MNDLRHAFRTLAATPIVTTAAVLSLALGIGANTAIFSLINSLVLRPLPVPNPEQLTILTEDGQDNSWSGPVWEQLREQQHLVDGAFAWFPPRLTLIRGSESHAIDTIFASGRFFEVLRTEAMLGRTFTDADDRRDGGPDGPVAVVGYEFWRRHFGGATDAIGRQLVLDSVAYTVIGVTPQGFFGPDVGRSFDVVLPLRTWALLRGPDNFLEERNSRTLRVMVRLKPRQDIAAAAAALNAIRPRIREATLPPNTSAQQLARYLTRPLTLRPAATGDSRVRGGYQRPLFTLLVIAALVLLIACVNIANLLLARTVARRHQISVMRALGASRWRIARQHLTESVILAGAGMTSGVVFAQWTSQILMRQLSTPSSTVFLDLRLDWRVLMFTSVVGIATAVVFGVLPALHAARVAPIESIKEQQRGLRSGNPQSIANPLVVGQVALSLVLVVAAGLFLRSFAGLAMLPLGFDVDRLTVAAISTSPTVVKTEQLPAIYAQVRQRAAAVAGVERVAMSRLLPLGSGESSTSFSLDGPQSAVRLSANTHEVSPDFFRTLGIPIIAGRDIELADRVATPRVALVNHAFVRRYLGGVNPIGRRIIQPALQPGVAEPIATEIVGVVGDAVYRVLRNPAPPTIYFALDQRAQQPSSTYLYVRAAGTSPAAMTHGLAAALIGMNAGIQFQFRAMEEQVHASLTRERLLAILTGFFGVLGVLLAGIGLFGVTSYAVTQRRAEISIRLAIGATPERVVRLVLGRVAMLVAAGIAAGVILTWWLAQFVSAMQLYGIQPRDLTTIAGAALLLAAVAAFAGWWPARRAARIDPAPLLREA